MTSAYRCPKDTMPGTSRNAPWISTRVCMTATLAAKTNWLKHKPNAHGTREQFVQHSTDTLTEDPLHYTIDRREKERWHIRKKEEQVVTFHYSRSCHSHSK